MTDALFSKHEAILKAALAAITARGYWSAFPESASPKNYGETAAAEGEAAFQARLGKPFNFGPGTPSLLDAQEISPFGIELGISYPAPPPDALIAAATAALPAWRAAGPDARAGLCLEILQRINKASFEIAHAVMHTTGQAFMMAFQAAGPHAQDRGLEAIAYAWRAMKETPAHAYWEKPQGKNEPLRMDKEYHIIPRGIAVMIGCSTFPTWNGYPGLFASLVTGNPVIIKPHPTAILPLAISVEICRQVLQEAGYPADLVQLAPDTAAAPLTKDLALHPAVRIVDFTGSAAFGSWLEENAQQARVYTEKAGVNFIIIHSADDLKAVVRNLAFTLSLYSGQMCTTSQNIFVPRTGVKVGDSVLDVEAVGKAIAEGVDKFLSDPERAVEILGAIQSPATVARITAARSLGRILLDSREIPHPRFPHARVRTPLLLAVDGQDEAVFTQELFGPIAFIVSVESIDAAIDLARKTALTHGALTASLYCVDLEVTARTELACIEAGVALSENLTGGVFVNQSAAFSDFHGTGANPAANAALCDSAFVADRFRVVQIRRHRPVAAA